MKRRDFLGWLAALPFVGGFLAQSTPLPGEVAVLPLPAAVPETLPLLVGEEAAIFPFFWNPEVVEGIVAVPLLDKLVAETVWINR